MRFTFLFLSLLFFIGCGSHKKPKNLLSEEKMSDLLVELHMFDAIAVDHTLNLLTGDIDSATIYTSLFAKYETNRETFEATMKWYSNNPEALSELYDKVFGIINKNHQNWNDQVDLLKITSNNSKSIFKSSRYKDVKGDTVNYPEPYIFKTDSAGTYLFDIRLRLFNDDKSRNPKIIAYFLDNDTLPTDSLEIINFPIVKSNYSRDYQFTAELTDNKYKFISLTVPQVDSIPGQYHKNLQLSSIKVAKKKVEKAKASENNPVEEKGNK